MFDISINTLNDHIRIKTIAGGKPVSLWKLVSSGEVWTNLTVNFTKYPSADSNPLMFIWVICAVKWVNWETRHNPTGGNKCVSILNVMTLLQKHTTAPLISACIYISTCYNYQMDVFLNMCPRSFVHLKQTLCSICLLFAGKCIFITNPIYISFLCI